MRGARHDQGIAGKVVPPHGVLVVTWQHGDLLLDTGFRLDARDVTAAHNEWISRLFPRPLGGGMNRVRRTSALLVLEDGRTFRGESFGAEGETFGEAVFSTGMSGYQETLTDPSYHKQVVVMTAPHVGNTGMNDEDPESSRIWVAGYVVRDPARIPSSWRSIRTLDDELRDQGVVGISGVDTRALTRHLRDRGAMRVGISTVETDPEARCGSRVLASAGMTGAALAGEVSTATGYVVPAVGERRYTVAAVDLGIKSNTPRMMSERGMEVHVLPATATVEEILAIAPDGVFYSNGPGDPATADHSVDVLRELLDPGSALLRHLLRQPALRPGTRVRHLQAQVRPPGDQPARDGPDHRKGRGDRPQPRLRGGRAPRRA